MDHDANPFELYRPMPGWKEASIDIEAVIKVAKIKVAKLEDPMLAYNEIRAVLHKYSPWGATDGPPTMIACQIFCEGTDLDPNEFYWA